MKRRCWKPEEVGALRITDLRTADRQGNAPDGATQSLLANGFKKDNIFDAPQKTTDDEGGFNAASPVLSQHPNIKKWVIYAINEETVLGGVRATEQLHIPASDVIGVGINGAGEAFAEFQEEGTDRLLRHDRRQLDGTTASRARRTSSSGSRRASSRLPIRRRRVS